MLLAFDTCLDRTYVAIGKNGTVIDSAVIENQGSTYHSAYLISTIKNILLKNNLAPKDITEIATDIGPGSFTGIRACMTVAKIISQQLNTKVYGISSLEIISKIAKTKEKTLVLLDARKNMCYVWDEEILGAIAIDDVKEMVKAGEYSIICDDTMYTIFSEITDDIVSYTKINHNFAEILTEIAPQKQVIDWKILSPLYIQPPPVFGK